MSSLILVLLTIFCFVCPAVVYPFVINDSKTFCTLRIHKRSIPMLDEIFDISLGSRKFHFSFCRPLPLHICDGAHACITDVQNQTVYFKASGMAISNSRQILTLLSENKCMHDPVKKVTIQIKFYCSDPIEESPELIKNSDCEYEVRMMAPPNSMCKFPQCTMNLSGHLLDLRSLRGVYDVRSEHSNFSIALCQENPKCLEKNITACETSGGQQIPLAHKDNELMLYNMEKQVYFRSSYTGSSHFQKKQLEITMKCNWNKLVPDIRYIEPSTQGMKYKFSMETSHACVKTPPKCEIPDLMHNNLYYNLSVLHKKSGYWEVKDAPGPIFLNICGPLKLQQAKNNCSRSFSQVCKVENGEYVNLGALQNGFSQVDGGIVTKFEAGDICNEKGNTYETSIKFECSNVEQGPKYLYSTDCGISILWSTPAACTTLYNNITCNKISNVNKCGFKYGGHVYDLSKLSKPVNYVIYSGDKREIEYLINICGSVIDDDIPCSKDDMAAVRYVNEVDYMKRWKFLGKMSRIFVVGRRIAIETSHGSFCDKQQLSSVLYLECSPSDEHIHLINKTNCRYEFLFRTKAACPSPILLTNDCTFRKPHGSAYRLDLRKTNNPVIKISYGEAVYIYNICSRSGHFCLETEHCIHAAVKRDLFVFENKMYLDFALDTDSPSIRHDFNRTLIELVCNPIEDNDYYTLTGTRHNILYMTLTTSLVCPQKEIIMPAVESLHLNKSSYIVIEESNVTTDPTIVKNPYNDYSFDIVKYNNEVSNVIHKNVTFFYADGSVMVEFVTKETCTEAPQLYYHYKFLIFCGTEHVVTSASLGLCIKKYTLRVPEGCKLLERDAIPTGTSNTSIIFSVSGTIIVLSLLIIVGLRAYKKRQRYQRYLKEGDL